VSSENTNTVGNRKAKMWNTSTPHNYKYLKNLVLNITISAVVITIIFYPYNPIISTHTCENESRPNGATTHLNFHWVQYIAA
jgi:predicted transglutaminase-like protease